MGNEEITLIGTEKQVKWANDIRERILTFAELLKPRFVEIVDKRIEKKKEEKEEVEMLEAVKENGLRYIDNVTKRADATYYIEKFRDVRETADAVDAFQSIYTAIYVEYSEVEKLTDKALSYAAGKTWSDLVSVKW